MPNSEKAFLEIRKYFTTWVTEVVLANTTGYFNINKISEGTALSLLNLIFDFELRDLNKQKVNYPGIDLGDDEKAMVAFQVTSQTDNTKVLSSLKTFQDKKFKDRFPNGIRFLIINNKKNVRKNVKEFAGFMEIFDPKTDIYYPEDLIKLIEQLYYKEEERFNKIKNLLRREFDNSFRQNNDKKLVVDFNSPLDKFTFYKRILTGIHQDSLNEFVQFECKMDTAEISTNDLKSIILNNDGILILGPSGCGKSILSRKLAVNFLEQGIAIILESKYYETDLNSLFEKSITAFGFSSGTDLFETSWILKLPVLFIIDGLNECEPTKKPKLLLELEKLKNDYQIKILISSQKQDSLFDPLGLLQIDVDYPSFETKRAIATVYSGKFANTKLDPILNTVSSALEAKMVGEIAVDDINAVSRFTLFEAFIGQKLGEEKSNVFLFLAHIARMLSDGISFSLPERRIDDILRANTISQPIYDACLAIKILDRTLGKVSFGHEMFFNFFVAESVIRFSPDAPSIIAQINSPRNYDKKLLIIGSIDDSCILDQVLESITDIGLLNALCQGDGGEYCKKWIERKLTEILKRIDQEITQVEYELNKEEVAGIGFIKATLLDWSNEQYALINLLPYRLVQGEFLQEFYSLVGIMDGRRQAAVKKLWEEGKQQGISVRYGTFSATYIGISSSKTAMASIISGLHSGFATFNNEASFTDEMVQTLVRNRSLNYGEFYFILVLLRWDERLKYLYPYALDVIRNKWQSVPSQLIHEILDRASYFHRTEEERQEFIEALNSMHSETQDAWMSTSIFDALSQIGALEEDANSYIPTVAEQIDKILNDVNSEDNWREANGLYNCQFDHPYDYAYQVAISNLEVSKKELFYQMALKGQTSVFFGTILFVEAFKLLKEKICPLISNWTENPIIEKSFPQDSIRVFLLSHIILAKYNYPLVSRFAAEDGIAEKSLFAAAELYYWNNRKDLTAQQVKDFSRKAESMFFDSSNIYVIDTLYECRHNILQASFRNIFESDSIVFIEDQSQVAIIDVCRFALQNLDWQKNIKNFSHGNDANTKAIYLLERLGSLVDVDLLRNLSEHPIYGEPSVKAIKELSQKIN
ncbi:SMEK domain-containing protein [Pedobacter nyackensis]|uniref:SMEK domain-containing protein n=1 Tax=Pedobacter nyackensis TaxID=475255 RepID=UPI00292CB2C5|nr:SMEK domain-containing protein [Pedobacter nyackensis]